MKTLHRIGVQPLLMSTYCTLLGVVTVLGISMAPAHAVSFIQALIQDGSFGTEDCKYSGGIGVPGGCNAGDEVPGANSVSASANVNAQPPNFPQAFGDASATLGALGNRAEGISRVGVFGNPAVKANAKYVIADLIFTGPVGQTEVTGSLNFLVDGSITGFQVPGGPVRSGEFSVTILANGGFVGSGSILGNNIGTLIANTGLFVGTGMSSSVNNALFTTGPITFTLDTPQSIQLATLATASAVSGFTGLGLPSGTITAQLLVDFGNTTNLSLTGPIFNLPQGFSVSSAAAGISNNQLGASIPSPVTLPLLLAGLAGLGLIGWRRRKAA